MKFLLSVASDGSILGPVVQKTVVQKVSLNLGNHKIRG